jgi:putative tryptophan/tyrosine transport system substrate-binding protein
LEAAVQTLRETRDPEVYLHSLEAPRGGDVLSVLDTMEWRPGDTLAPLGNPTINAQLPKILELATERRLPTVGPNIEFALAGGFLSYGPVYACLYYRAGSFVKKILGGQRPGSIPIELPSKFELAVNLRTAQQLGITLPPSFVDLVDQPIGAEPGAFNYRVALSGC